MKIRLVYPPSAALIPFRALLAAARSLIGCGKAVEARRDELRAYFGTKHVFLVVSGKAALYLLLRALHSMRPERGEILIPAYTCYSVPSAIIKAGLRPRLADVAANSFGFEESGLVRAANTSTLCVLASHLLGYPENMDMVRKVARDCGAFVVEDAAQAMGGRRDGRFLGTIGDVGFFSLGRGKNVTCGAGGVILTNDDSIARHIALQLDNLVEPTWRESATEFVKAILLSIFIRPHFYWIPSGIPQLRLGETRFEHDFRIDRMSSVQAGLLHGWQTRLERSNRARRRNAEALSMLLRLKQLGLDVIPLRLPWLANNRDEKGKVLMWSQENGLGFSGMYPLALHKVRELEAGVGGEDFPNALRLSERLVTIPTNELTGSKYRAKIAPFNNFRERSDEQS